MSPAQGAWRFEVEAMLDPQSLLRVIGYFAQRSIVPVEVTMRAAGAGMTISLTATDLVEDHARIIAAKLEQIVLVDAVRLEAPLQAVA